jgi:hypothetical protein
MQQAAPATDDGYRVTMTGQPSPPTVGPGILTFTLQDSSGRPVEGATVTVEGNMSHAGMIPVTGVMQSASGGEYRAALEWTMAGDWFVDVAFGLADGTTVARRFPVAVR